MEKIYTPGSGGDGSRVVIGQAVMGRAAKGRVAMGQAVTGRVRMGQVGTGRAKMGQLGMGRSGTGRSRKKLQRTFLLLTGSHPLQLRFRYSLRIVSAMDKPSKRRHAKSALSSKEDMESELNRKLPKLDSRVPAQSAPLTEEGFTPVEIQSSSAPTFDGTSNIEPQGFYPDDGYDYGARYGGYQTTRFNSTLVNDEKADARGDFRYHQHRQSAQTARYVGAYSAPFSDPSARSRGFRASFDDSKRESQASQALDRIERIMERMERQQAASTYASSASSAQLHAFIGQGEFHLSFLLKF
jgi:hypothetical protein